MSSEEQPVALSEAPEAPRDVTHAPTSPSQPPSAVAVTSRPDGGEVSHLNQPTPMSKSALKRLRKQKEWEDRREDRRLKRREKKQAHKLKVRAERQALIAGGADPRVVYNRDKRAAVLVPMAIVVDCDFEKYMTDKERISLSSQVTRAYSDNRNAKFRAHLWVAGFRGKLEARFNDVLQAQQRSWKGASVFAGDFVACAAAAREQMAATKTVTPDGEDGEAAAAAAAAQKTHEQLLIGPLRRSLESPAPWPRDAQDPFPLPGEPEPPLDPAHKDVVYLSSDSPYTLSRLEPGTTYVVGGLVDKNREKGLCYRRARERGIRTARLPIGEYMVMHSRQVLATNHVVDIMLKWLEHEDWGKAFLSVIPKRKGGVLRGEAAAGEAAEQAQEGSGEPADDDEDDEHVEEEEEEGRREGEEVDPAEEGSGQHAKKETPKEGTGTA